jgi:hypothetical protein
MHLVFTCLVLYICVYILSFSSCSNVTFYTVASLLFVGTAGSPFFAPCTEAGLETAVEGGYSNVTFLCSAPTTVLAPNVYNFNQTMFLDGNNSLTIDCILRTPTRLTHTTNTLSLSLSRSHLIIASHKYEH